MSLKKILVLAGCFFLAAEAHQNIKNTSSKKQHYFWKHTLFAPGERFKSSLYKGIAYIKEMRTSEHINLKAVALPEGGRASWYQHRGEHFILVTDNSGYYIEDGGIVCPIQAGTMIRIKPETKYIISASPNERIGYMNVNIPKEKNTTWRKTMNDGEFNEVISNSSETIPSPNGKNIAKMCGNAEITYTMKNPKSKNVLFGWGTKMKSPHVNKWSKHSSGEEFYVNPLSDNGLIIKNVTLLEGNRTNWHTHHGSGQILLVISGRGFYQKWKNQQKAIKRGDILVVPAETKHRVSSAYNSILNFIEIRHPSERKGQYSTEWFD